MPTLLSCGWELTSFITRLGGFRCGKKTNPGFQEERKRRKSHSVWMDAPVVSHGKSQMANFWAVACRFFFGSVTFSVTSLLRSFLLFRNVFTSLWTCMSVKKSVSQTILGLFCCKKMIRNKFMRGCMWYVVAPPRYKNFVCKIILSLFLVAQYVFTPRMKVQAWFSKFPGKNFQGDRIPQIIFEKLCCMVGA